MSRKLLVIMIVMALVFAIVSVLLAKEKTTKQTQLPEFNRCSRTCTTLTAFYNKNYPMMKTREGNKECWQNCWNRYGNKTKAASVAAQKSLWMGKMSQNMRNNQCAQACWRNHHSNSSMVSVAGWRSTPRGTACYK
jgi:hypothetical protein